MLDAGDRNGVSSARFNASFLTNEPPLILAVPIESLKHETYHDFSKFWLQSYNHSNPMSNAPIAGFLRKFRIDRNGITALSFAFADRRA